MAYYRRRKSYGGSVSLVMTFILGFALGMGIMYLFMALFGAREQGTAPVAEVRQFPENPLNASTTLQNIEGEQGRHIIPVLRPDTFRYLWRDVIVELRPAVVVLRADGGGDPRIMREAIAVLNGLRNAPAVLLDTAGEKGMLSVPDSREGQAATELLAAGLLETLRQWEVSGWFGPCLAYASPKGGSVSQAVDFFGISMPPADAVQVGLNLNRFLLENGMAVAAWSFPGAPDSYSPEGLPLITESDFDLLARSVEPFLQAIQAGSPALVVGQIAVPALDARKPPRPACASPVIVRDLLRQKWQYDGLILGDALDPVEIAGEEDISSLAVRCLAAGCDAALVDFDRQDTAVGVLMSFNLAGLPAEQLRQSAERLERFRQRYAGRAAAAPEKAEPASSETPGRPDSDHGSQTVPSVPEHAPQAAEPGEAETTGGITTDTVSTAPAPEKPVSGADADSETESEPSPRTDTGSPAHDVSEKTEEPAAPPSPEAQADQAVASEAGQEGGTETAPVSQAGESVSEAQGASAESSAVLPPPDTPFIEHRIEPGEGLSTIAQKYGVPLADLKAWNGITDANRIVAGTVLRIYRQADDAADANQAAPSAPAVDEGANPAPGSDAAPAVPESTPAAEGQQEIKSPDPTVSVSAADETAYEIYVVQPGDTLGRISARYGISQAELMRINNIQDKNLVKLGSRLKVPVKAGESAESAQPEQ